MLFMMNRVGGPVGYNGEGGGGYNNACADKWDASASIYRHLKQKQAGILIMSRSRDPRFNYQDFTFRKQRVQSHVSRILPRDKKVSEQISSPSASIY